MSSAFPASSNAFTASASDRIAQYVAKQDASRKPKIIALTPDASTRVYFRIPWKPGTAIAAVYPEPFDPEVHPYLDVTRLFIECGLPVPEVYEADGAAGVIVQEDLGDEQLFKVFETATDEEREELLERSIEIIARIQAATKKAFERNSIASRLAFDEAKLSWELNFFFEHYFGSLRKEDLREAEAAELKVELNDIADELAAVPRVLCHRDYHSRNLMVHGGGLYVIDFQDARMGPDTYDLASLLRDSYVDVTDRERDALVQYFLTLKGAGDTQDFRRRFDLVSLQRNLKALGTFGYQTTTRGNPVYIQYIPRTLNYARMTLEKYPRFARLRELLAAHIDELR